MDYTNARTVLPDHLIEMIQQYIDGDTLYIPRKCEHKKGWGELSGSRALLDQRNRDLYKKYREGDSIHDLSNEYFLSTKSVQRIVRCEGLKK